MNVRDLAAKGRELGRSKFSAVHDNLFLLVTRAAPTEESANFWTAVADEAELHADLEQTTMIAPLVKRPGNPYPDRIGIGRARNCDVAIVDASLSKLHAHVRREADGWVIIDLGSQNGTFLGDRALKPHEATPLTAGTDVTFGTVKARVFDAAGLFDALSALGAFP